MLFYSELERVAPVGLELQLIDIFKWAGYTRGVYIIVASADITKDDSF